MALLAPHAGDLSGAESPLAGSLDGGGSWPPNGGGSFGGVGGGTTPGAISPASSLVPLAVPPPLLSAHQISVDDDDHGTEDGEGGGGRGRDVSSSDSEDEDPGATSASSVFTLCNSAIGAGVLSLPFAFRRAGLGGGLALCVAVGSVEAFTLCVLFIYFSHFPGSFSTSSFRFSHAFPRSNPRRNIHLEKKKFQVRHLQVRRAL